MEVIERIGQSVHVGSAALIGVCTLLVLASCAKAPRHAVLDWVEPVTLASGETIQIKRHVEMWHEQAFGGGYASAPIYKSSSIELSAATPEFPKWDAPLVPLVLERDRANGEWLVVASADSCDFWRRNGKPAIPYWTFRLRNGQWYRVETPDELVGRPANLFIEFDVTDSSSQLVDSVGARKLRQTQQPQHAPHFTKIDPSPQEFYEGCGQPGGAPAGLDFLDLKGFRSLP